jgi:very-short-patch-repair endonuclease
MIKSVECWVPNLHVDAVLVHLLAEQGLPSPVREHQFDEKRKYRFDYAFLDQKIALEVEGGRWRPHGAHNTGSAIARDCAKYNEAQLQGWMVLRVFPETLHTEETVLLVKRAFEQRQSA